MDKILFENGTKIAEGYVEIDGTRHNTVQPQYVGETPLSAENLNQMQSNIEDEINKTVETTKKEILETVFPIGSTYITQTDTNPTKILGFGIWERLKGRIPLGLDENEEYFNEINKEGGETKHTQTIKELARHSHSTTSIPKENPWVAPNSGFNYSFTDQQTYQHTTNATGDGQPFNVTQPYKIVGYMWLRTD